MKYFDLSSRTISNLPEGLSWGVEVTGKGEDTFHISDPSRLPGSGDAFYVFSLSRSLGEEKTWKVSSEFHVYSFTGSYVGRHSLGEKTFSTPEVLEAALNTEIQAELDRWIREVVPSLRVPPPPPRKSRR